MSSNSTTLQDEDGDFPDWIELFNASNTVVNLHNFRISDTEQNPNRWIFPSVNIAPGAFVVIFASGKNRYFGPNLHTNFSISADGEALLLSNASGQIIDFVDPVLVPTDQSYGRLPDASGTWTYFDVSTPGASNALGNITLAPDDILQINKPGGFYKKNELVTIEAKSPDIQIRYTQDGSKPDTNSLLYLSSVILSDALYPTDHLINISTSELHWQAPDSLLPKGIILRAAGFLDGNPVTHEANRTYFLDEDWNGGPQLPIFALMMDEEAFFSPTSGIYVPGNPKEINPNNPHYWNSGEWWEREIEVAFINRNGKLVLQQEAGARIHGAGTRRNPQKSIRLYARNRYGESTFNYPFFEHKPHIDSYKRLILRSTMGDWRKIGFTDEFSAAAVRPMNLDYMEYLPVLVFINGEFWGIHHLRERIDKHYFESNHDVDPESLDFLDDLGEVSEGDDASFYEMMNFFRHANPNAEGFYSQADAIMDLENTADYYVAQIYLRNIDWPFRNYSYWKPENGRWRWVFYDCDACFIRFGDNNLVDLLQDDQIMPPNVDDDYFLVIRQLLKNETFKELFQQRFYYHLQTTFSAERLLPILDGMEKEHFKYLPEHIRRWHFPHSENKYVRNVQDLRDFVLRRNLELGYQLSTWLDISFEMFPNPLRIADRKVNLNIPAELISHEMTLSLRDVHGRLLLHIIFSSSLESFNLPAGISAGLYFVEINNGRFTVTNKLTVID